MKEITQTAYEGFSILIYGTSYYTADSEIPEPEFLRIEAYKEYLGEVIASFLLTWDLVAILELPQLNKTYSFGRARITSREFMIGLSLQDNKAIFFNGKEFIEVPVAGTGEITYVKIQYDESSLGKVDEIYYMASPMAPFVVDKALFRKIEP